MCSIDDKVNTGVKYKHMILIMPIYGIIIFKHSAFLSWKHGLEIIFMITKSMFFKRLGFCFSFWTCFSSSSLEEWV